jgi:hypothetical protein
VTARTNWPDASVWADEIEAFLADEALTRNPRSVTAVRMVDGRRYHFKHSRESLAAEARGFELAGTVGEVAGVRAVALTVFDEHANVLVTEGEEGESLFNALWNGSSRLASARRRSDWPAVLGRSAGWLAAFHRLSGESVSRDLAPLRRASAEECLEHLRRSFGRKLAVVRESRRAPLSPAEADGLLERVEEELRPDLWREVPIRYLHGDFAPANQLFCADGSIRILDFGDARVGFALEDLVRLWTSVWELTHCGRLRARLLHPALARMLGDYGLSSGVPESRPFRLLRAWNAVTQVSVACVSRSRYDFSTAWTHRRLMQAERGWLRREILGRARG